MALTLGGRVLLNKHFCCVGVRSLHYSKNENMTKGKAAQEKWRKEFLTEEFERDQKVEKQNLSDSYLEIYELHKEAVNSFKFTYIDPPTGLKVLTTYRHFLKMKCCGNACRHCIYDHEAVEKERKDQRMFNSAFWVDKPHTDTDKPKDVPTPDFEMFIKTKPINTKPRSETFLSSGNV